MPFDKTMSNGPILIISGTNRPQSSALRIARHLADQYAQLNIEAPVLDLCDLPEGLLSPRIYLEKPPAFQAIQRQVIESAGMHLVVPEYNGSFPGILKYFIDLLKFPDSFDRRPVAFVGESGGAWGALRAVEQLQLVFGYRNAFSFPERVFIPKVKEQFDADGRIHNADLESRLKRQVEGFALFVDLIGRIP